MEKNISIAHNGNLHFENSDIVMPVYSLGKYSFVPANSEEDLSIEEINSGKDSLEDNLMLLMVNTEPKKLINPRESLFAEDLLTHFQGRVLDFRMHRILTGNTAYENSWGTAVDKFLKSGVPSVPQNYDFGVRSALQDYTGFFKEYKISNLRDPIMAKLFSLEEELSTGTNL